MNQDLNIKRNLFSITEQFTKVNGKMKTDMDMGYKFGQMELNMRVIGKTTRHMVKVNFGMLMVMCLMVSGGMTKLMAMECIFTLMAQSMKANGSMICNMARELKHGRMAQSTMGFTKKE